jgi:hypothetical protein
LKIVGTQLKRLSVCILVAFFTISVLFVNPLLADASTAQKQSSKPKVKVETLAKGTKYATKLYIIDSGKPGPVVMIVGGVHGNERAGYTAAAKVKDWNIKKGTLLVLPKANVMAVDKKVRYLSKQGDLNRKFPKSSSQKGSNTLSRAQGGSSISSGSRSSERRSSGRSTRRSSRSGGGRNLSILDNNINRYTVVITTSSLPVTNTINPGTTGRIVAPGGVRRAISCS